MFNFIRILNKKVSTNFTKFNFYSNSISKLDLNNKKLQIYLQNLCDEFYTLKTSNINNKLKTKRLIKLSPITELYEQRKCAIINIENLNEMKNETDPEMIQLMKEEREVYSGILNRLDKEIINSLLNMDENQDFSSLYLEVTAGVGGQEAMLFAREIFDMYCNYVDFKSWNSEILSIDTSDNGGIRHASSVISGDDVYSFLKYEAGVHRVQRIPATEKSGRIHTSTISVAVIPKPDDFQITINDKDLKLETKRASGAGGQHVNTTDSAVRIVHIPTGISVECQSERSQIKNKAIALKKLESKLIEIQLNKTITKENETRKSQIGQSLRNEKIRTYNFNQDRITDHRLEQGSIFNMEVFLEGGQNLDNLIKRLKIIQREKELIDAISKL